MELATVRVEIYTKADCCLCAEAKRVLLRVREDIPFKLHEIDIEKNPEYYEPYKEQIPVVFINGKKAFKYRVDEKQLRQRLKRLSAER